MKLNFKTEEQKIIFKEETKIGRPKKTTEKADKVKKIFFTKSELEEIENLYIKELENENISLSSFLKKLIKKGIKC